MQELLWRGCARMYQEDFLTAIAPKPHLLHATGLAVTRLTAQGLKQFWALISGPHMDAVRDEAGHAASQAMHALSVLLDNITQHMQLLEQLAARYETSVLARVSDSQGGAVAQQQQQQAGAASSQLHPSGTGGQERRSGSGDGSGGAGVHARRSTGDTGTGSAGPSAGPGSAGSAEGIVGVPPASQWQQLYAQEFLRLGGVSVCLQVGH